MKCRAIVVPVVVFLIGVGSLPRRVLAQGVGTTSQTPAGTTTPKPSVSAYIEVRSVMRDDQVQAADEKPAAPRVVREKSPRLRTKRKRPSRMRGRSSPTV